MKKNASPDFWLESGVGSFIFFLAIMVIFGWLARDAYLVQLRPQFVAMVFSTAICFSLVGISFLLPTIAPRQQTAVKKIIGGTLVIIGTLVFFENILDIHLFNIDFPSLHSWLKDGNPSPGRMAPNTTICFILAGTILILSQRVTSKAIGIIIQCATFLMLFLGLAGLVGYLLQLELLYGFKATRMAAHTALGMVLTSIGFWSNWHRAPWYSSHQYFSDSDKITYVGTSILIVVALTTGVAGFAAQQATFEKVLAQNLASAVKSQSLIFHIEIDQTTARVNAIATRPSIVRIIRELNKTPEDEKSA